MLLGGGGVRSALEHLRLSDEELVVAQAVTQAAVDMDLERRQKEIDVLGQSVGRRVAEVLIKAWG